MPSHSSTMALPKRIDLGLLVGHPRRQPGRPRRLQRLGRGLGDQRVDRRAEPLRRLERVGVARRRDVGIGRDHRRPVRRRARPGRKQRRGPEQNSCQLHDSRPPAVGRADLNSDGLSREPFTERFSQKSEEGAPAAPSRPGPEPGQRPTAPRAAASRPPAVAPLPSSRVDAGFGTQLIPCPATAPASARPSASGARSRSRSAR